MNDSENESVSEEINMAVDKTSSEELSHTDKASGIFTEPKRTFHIISLFPQKTIDWFLPVLILMLVVSITRVLVMSNEDIYFQFKQKQIKDSEKIFDDMVAKGQMTREQADKQLEEVKDRMDMGRGPAGIILQTVSILIGGFIFFFIITAVYFVFVKLILKGDGSYKSALIANGLPSYISMLQILIATIFSLVFNRLMNDTSAASFLNLSKSEISGFLLGKVDPFSVWVYSVMSIGMAKMFKSPTLTKYFILVFVIWIIGSLLLWLLGKAIPFISFVSEM